VVNIALIGAGGLARRHVEALAGIEDGLAALRISHAILASHHERRVVTIGE
jgi:hypothetical protein